MTGNGAQSPRGLDLPPRVRESLARAVRGRGPQARAVSTQARDSMRPPTGHVVVAAPSAEIEGVRGAARVVRQLEFYRTAHGPVVRLAFSIYPVVPGEDPPFSAATLLNVSQVSGEAALAGLGRQRTLPFHFYALAEGDDLDYRFSKEVRNGPTQRAEAKKVHALAREAYTRTPAERRSFRAAVSLAEGRFELPVPEPDDEG